MHPDTRALLEGYFATFNAGDEEGHMALIESDVRYFGSLSAQVMRGAASARGIFRGVRSSLGITGLTPLRWFGDAPELAALVRLDGILHQDGSAVEAVFHFEVSERGRIARLGIFWNIGPLRA